MNWIKVTDRLPEKGQMVLVWIKYKDKPEFTYAEAYWDDVDDLSLYVEPNTQKEWGNLFEMFYEITHWALIEGPKT